MRAVVVHPGDKALFFLLCPHCEQGFGKGTFPEVVFESPDQLTALHRRCVDELAAMPAPDELAERQEAVRRQLMSDVSDLTA